MGATRALFVKRFGLSNETPTDYGIDNNTALMSRNAAGTADLEIARYDEEDNLLVGGAYARKPMRIPCIFKAVANAAVATTRFHIFNYSGTITKITEIHGTKGTAGTAVTGTVTKESSGQAPGAGVSVMTGSFNMKGDDNTEQTATLSSAVNNAGASVLRFNAGDMLSFKLTGANTSLAGVLLMVWVQPDVPALDFSFYSAAVTSQDQAFFIANRQYPIRAIRYVHATAEETDTTSNVQVSVDDGTEAPGAGTNLLTNDGNAGFDLNATANVPQVGVFAATKLVAGDRVSLDFDAANTEGAGVCVTVTVFPQADRLEIPFWLYAPAATDAWFFSADRDYEIWDGRQVHAVAAGGTSTANIEKASGTTNASGGTATLGTAWDLNATANTVQVLAPVTVKATLLLAAADRLAIDYAHAVQSTAGVCQTISLLAR